MSCKEEIQGQTQDILERVISQLDCEPLSIWGVWRGGHGEGVLSSSAHANRTQISSFVYYIYTSFPRCNTSLFLKCCISEKSLKSLVLWAAVEHYLKQLKSCFLLKLQRMESKINTLKHDEWATIDHTKLDNHADMQKRDSQTKKNLCLHEGMACRR